MKRFDRIEKALYRKAVAERRKLDVLWAASGRAFDRMGGPMEAGLGLSSKTRRAEKLYKQLDRKIKTQEAKHAAAVKRYRDAESASIYRAATQRNPAKSVRVKNFTGTITTNANGTVSIRGRKK